MNILDEGKFDQEISITLVFNFHAFITSVFFCQSLGHQTNNHPYWSNSVLPTHIILTNHKPYLVSLHVQSSIPNIQNLIYPLTLPNVACKEITISFNSIFLTKNVMEQNLIGFPNSMYFMLDPIHHIFVWLQGHRGCSYNVASYVQSFNQPHGITKTNFKNCTS